MNVSINWLKDYLDLNGLTVEKISETLTDIGLEVEATAKLAKFGESVVAGRISAIRPHPNADNLRICTVDIGQDTPLQIVCGAANAREGISVCVATVGSILPGDFKIKPAKIRGEESFGMLCSSKELGLGEGNDGIMELSSEPKPGSPIIKILGLDDTTLTLNVTPNRADCLGHIGVARDLSARLLRPLNLPKCSPKTTQLTWSKDIKIDLQTNRCSRFVAMAIDDVQTVPSPAWLKQRIEASGMRPINLIVDLTNYVMLEMNHPIHAYDARFIDKKSFVIRNARNGETLKTLDGQERVLVDGDVLICDATKIIGLAGVMGGLNSEVKPDTTAVVLEVACFDADSIRATARRLGVHTEASHRFERGVDILDAERVAKRFAELLIDCAEDLRKEGVRVPHPKISSDIHDIFPEKPSQKLIALRVNETKAFLAMPHLTQDLIKKYFSGLEFRLVDHNQDRMVFEIPSWRVDIERECDLVEEIARLHGYDKIPLQLPAMSLKPTPEDTFVSFQEEVRQSLGDQGFRETISFPFWSRTDQKNLRLAASHPLAPSVKLINPISDDASHLQTTLAVGLLKAVANNRRHGIKSSRLFEVGRGYFDFSKSPLATSKDSMWFGLNRIGRHLTHKARSESFRPTERHWVAGVLDHPFLEKSWRNSERSADFFDVKLLIESWLSGFGVRKTTWTAVVADDLPFLHPGTSAVVSANRKCLGWVGQVHPEASASYDLNPTEAPYLFEFDLETLIEASLLKLKVNTESQKFPPSTRDLALIVDELTTHDAMAQSIGKFPAKSNLKTWNLFDIYQGENIPKGKKSVAWSFSFQSPERTLTDAEVEGEFKQLSEYLSKTFGADHR
jgi:phenylalanyl-tRNA synthetase beta chain